MEYMRDTVDEPTRNYVAAFPDDLLAGTECIPGRSFRNLLFIRVRFLSWAYISCKASLLVIK